MTSSAAQDAGNPHGPTRCHQVGTVLTNSLRDLAEAATAHPVNENDGGLKAVPASPRTM